MSKDLNPKATYKMDDEVLVLSRVERLLAKLPSDDARQRVLEYLVSRHQVKPIAPLSPSGCNQVPLSPGRSV
jgi:hypothetical protein